MRIHVPCSALGLALAAIAPTAQAQTVYAPQPVVTVPPATTVVTPSVRTVRTVTTVRTVHPLAHHRVAETRTTTTTVAQAPAVAAAYPAPVYDYVTPAPVAPAPAVVPAAAFPAAPTMSAGAAVPFYRYVYQPDRILVIDPNTGIAVQAIPR